MGIRQRASSVGGAIRTVLAPERVAAWLAVVLAVGVAVVLAAGRETAVADAVRALPI